MELRRTLELAKGSEDPLSTDLKILVRGLKKGLTISE